MKKIFSLCILILTLCLSSTVFGAKAWSETELEEFFKNMGYGEHDISSFSGSTSYLTTFFNDLNSANYNKIILKISDNKFCIVITGSSNVNFILTNNKYALSTQNWVVLSSIYELDLANESFYYPNSQSYTGYVPASWKKENYTVTEEEWNSTEFKTFLFEQACLYSDTKILNTNYIPKGGRIVNSSFGDTIYTGSISYGNTTETATIVYTSGFDSSSSYDLFLERYQLSESYDYGIAEYPLTTYDLVSLTTSDTSFKVDISNFALSSNSVYRLCLGKNTFEDTGSNEVYLCTDWLLPNNNTLWKFPTFTRSHYFQPLNLVAYDSNYQDSVIPDDPEEGSSGDVGSDIEDYLPYFISVPAYPQKNECLVYFYVGDYGLNNLSFLIEKIDDSGGILSSNSLSISIINSVSYGMAKVDFCKYFSFEDNSFYKITLVGKNGVKLDTSSVIYFLGSNTGNYEGDNPYIINAPKGYVRNSGDVVVTVFIPSGYDYEDSVYLSVQKYNLSGDYISSTVIADSNMWLQLDSESGICPIYVSSFCDFDTGGNYYYRINLNEFNKGTLDITDIFYFDIDTGENIDKDNLPINPNNPSFDFDTTDINSLIDSTSIWVDSIFSFLNIFPPWLITSIMAGIAVVVICRILGR